MERGVTRRNKRERLVDKSGSGMACKKSDGLKPYRHQRLQSVLLSLAWLFLHFFRVLTQAWDDLLRSRADKQTKTGRLHLAIHDSPMCDELPLLLWQLD